MELNSEGPGAPSVWFLGRRDRGHPPKLMFKNIAIYKNV